MTQRAPQATAPGTVQSPSRAAPPPVASGFAAAASSADEADSGVSGVGSGGAAAAAAAAASLSDGVALGSGAGAFCFGKIRKWARAGRGPDAGRTIKLKYTGTGRTRQAPGVGAAGARRRDMYLSHAMFADAPDPAPAPAQRGVGGPPPRDKSGVSGGNTGNPRVDMVHFGGIPNSQGHSPYFPGAFGAKFSFPWRLRCIPLGFPHFFDAVRAVSFNLVVSVTPVASPGGARGATILLNPPFGGSCGAAILSHSSLHFSVAAPQRGRAVGPPDPPQLGWPARPAQPGWVHLPGAVPSLAALARRVFDGGGGGGGVLGGGASAAAPAMHIAVDPAAAAAAGPPAGAFWDTARALHVRRRTLAEASPPSSEAYGGEATLTHGDARRVMAEAIPTIQRS
eukprot:gene5410-biopygen13268